MLRSVVATALVLPVIAGLSGLLSVPTAAQQPSAPAADPRRQAIYSAADKFSQKQCGGWRFVAPSRSTLQTTSNPDAFKIRLFNGDISAKTVDGYAFDRGKDNNLRIWVSEMFSFLYSFDKQSIQRIEYSIPDFFINGKFYPRRSGEKIRIAFFDGYVTAEKRIFALDVEHRRDYDGKRGSPIYIRDEGHISQIMAAITGVKGTAVIMLFRIDYHVPYAFVLPPEGLRECHDYALSVLSAIPQKEP